MKIACPSEYFQIVVYCLTDRDTFEDYHTYIISQDELSNRTFAQSVNYLDELGGPYEHAQARFAHHIEKCESCRYEYNLFLDNLIEKDFLSKEERKNNLLREDSNCFGVMNSVNISEILE